MQALQIIGNILLAVLGGLFITAGVMADGKITIMEVRIFLVIVGAACILVSVGFLNESLFSLCMTILSYLGGALLLIALVVSIPWLMNKMPWR